MICSTIFEPIAPGGEEGGSLFTGDDGIVTDLFFAGGGVN